MVSDLGYRAKEDSGATVLAQQFGVASSTTGFPVGLLGIGPGIELTLYPTIIDQLALQGITNSRAFSLDLRGVDSPDGRPCFTPHTASTNVPQGR